MKLAESADQDFGCMTRATWMATEDLFGAENGSLYIARLKIFDTQYREQSLARPQLTDAPIIDDEVTQLRAHAMSLAPSSEKWQNKTFVEALGVQYGCD